MRSKRLESTTGGRNVTVAMIAVVQRSARIVIAIGIAASLAIVLAVLGSSHEVVPTSDSGTATTSSLTPETVASSGDPTAHPDSAPVPGDSLVTCGGVLLCLIALLIAAVSIRRKQGSWRAPATKRSRPIVCAPYTGSLSFPHLSGRLIC
ncbi:hypothetical protein [Aeromicrobium sp. CTD01-1L150]|uniref:hypothetical protein n=1 Tax=Aeromicrobium sp. CTD01-1L150 TaxID=3341830 RepID=UPI0035C04A92